MKKILKEFKEFISRGNVLDMAVGMIIGAAFTAIIKSLVDDIFDPLLGLILGKVNLTNLSVKLGNTDSYLRYGNFLNSVITFLLTAIALFFVIKVINGMRNIGKKKQNEEPAAPTTKVCPFCKSEIAIDATRCPHCTSELED